MSYAFSMQIRHFGIWHGTVEAKKKKNQKLLGNFPRNGAIGNPAENSALGHF